MIRISFIGVEYITLVMAGCLAVGYFLLFLKLKFLLSWSKGTKFTIMSPFSNT